MAGADAHAEILTTEDKIPRSVGAGRTVRIEDALRTVLCHQGGTCPPGRAPRGNASYQLEGLMKKLKTSNRRPKSSTGDLEDGAAFDDSLVGIFA